MYTAYPLDTSGPNHTGTDGQACKDAKGCSVDSYGVEYTNLPYTAIQVSNYANKETGNQLFHDDFAKVFKKLSVLGYGIPEVESEDLKAPVAGKMGKLRYVDLEKC